MSAKSFGRPEASLFRMRVRVDAARKKVLLQDERETYLKSWKNLRHEFFKGVYKFARENDRLWGRRQDGSLGELYSFSFDSERLKEPIRQLIAQGGWALDETKSLELSLTAGRPLAARQRQRVRRPLPSSAASERSASTF